MRYLAKLSYDGSKYYGFQRLNNLPTVQKELENALKVINKNEVLVKGAGRTDRGVHALSQMAHFDLNINISVTHLKKAINSLLSPYLKVESLKTVQDDFHARHNVIRKRYCYKINLGKYDPKLFDYTYECPYRLDINRMKKASKLFLGVHNFEAFVSGSRDDYTAIIYKINFKMNKDILEIIFTGKSFYRYMVRNLVGALIDIGRNKKEINDIEKLLENPSKNSRFTTAVPQGLYLEEVKY